MDRLEAGHPTVRTGVLGVLRVGDLAATMPWSRGSTAHRTGSPNTTWPDEGARAENEIEAERAWRQRVYAAQMWGRHER